MKIKISCMKKILTITTVIFAFCSVHAYSQSDSLYPYTDKELLKLSNLIYELEKNDSAATADEPNGFDMKDKYSINDPTLLVDLTDDSVHYYTGEELIKLSEYIFELERRDSIRQANALAGEANLDEVFYCVQIGAYVKNPKINGIQDFHKLVKGDGSGVVKYLSGHFDSYDEAVKRKEELLSERVTNEAYILIIKNGIAMN